MNTAAYWLSILFILFAIIIGLWDTWHLYKGNEMATVSTLLKDWSMRHPILPFVLGVIVGHVFW